MATISKDFGHLGQQEGQHQEQQPGQQQGQPYNPPWSSCRPPRSRNSPAVKNRPGFS